jgi:diketogulonate reductase-like aldo/keto reductase
MISRRGFIKGVISTWAASTLYPKFLFPNELTLIKKPIPVSGEQIPIIGMGTSRTFSATPFGPRLLILQQVLQGFFDMGGGLIDSSPMYGYAERVLGKLLPQIENKEGLFSATKVWTDGKESGISQMNLSLKLWGLDKFDLMQIHNLRDWKTHLKTLRDWKEKGKIRYLGITTSHGMLHDEFEVIMKNEQLDFVQFSYNIENREAEKRLLPLAADRNIATIINRAYKRGELFSKVKGKELPKWAEEFDCKSWGQFFLKFIASHPNVTNIIPATSKPKHMIDNM